MFNLQGSELIIIMLLALVVLGPEKLPEAMRKAGQMYAQLKKMSTGFQQEFKAALDEPMREVRETANMLRDSADFRKLSDGDREEKPKSAEMAAVAPEESSAPDQGVRPAEMVAPADPTAQPTSELPFGSDAVDVADDGETEAAGEVSPE